MKFRVRRASKCSAFRGALDDCGLDDLGYSGYNLTWTNGQAGESNIQERLDRCVANIDWVCMFPSFRIEHLVRLASDHCPVFLSWERQCSRSKRKHRVYRFEAMWLQDESVIQSAWSEFHGLLSYLLRQL